MPAQQVNVIFENRIARSVMSTIIPRSGERRHLACNEAEALPRRNSLLEIVRAFALIAGRMPALPAYGKSFK
jgi:hypothetical protein